MWELSSLREELMWELSSLGFATVVSQRGAHVGAVVSGDSERSSCGSMSSLLTVGTPFLSAQCNTGAGEC